MCGFIAQLVEHRTGIAEVTGSNPIEALIFFFQASSFQLLKLENLLRLSFFTFTFIFLSLIDYSSTQGSVSRKLWNLFGPEKPFLVNLIKKQRGVYAENFLYEESLCSY